MQPYLFPYLGYFQLIHASDAFIGYGHVQYIKKGWFNRNRILLNGEPFLFSFSLKNDEHQKQAVDRFYSQKFEEEKKWFLRTIENAYRRAPYFENVYGLIQEILGFSNNNLVKFNWNSIVKLCGYAGIDTEMTLHKSIEVDNFDKQQRVLKFCEIKNADNYINPIGGINLYSKQYFSDNRVALKFLKSKLPAYNQFSKEFIAGLSIIDVLMFNSKEEVKKMLDEYELL